MAKKIAVIGPCVNMGGIERASSTLANYAAGQGFNVMYLAIFKHPRFFELNPAIFYNEPTDGTNVSKLDIPKTIFRIRREIKKYNPDTILAYNKFYASLALIALAGTGRKVFISERSSPFYKWPAKIELINKLAVFLKKPAGIVAQTFVAAKHQAKRYGNTPVKVIPNAVRQIKQYPEIARQKIILAVGRFGDPLKGFDRLVEAFALVENKEWKLVFAGGTADESPQLTTRAHELGVLNNIVFLGKVAEIDKIYAEAGIFVIPSRSEGFPNALAEAMTAGVPCISYDFYAGPRDIITPDIDGILVEDGDISALAGAINKLIADDNSREKLGINAAANAHRFNEHKIGKEVIDFILGGSKH
jgi:GalNAc-alpha-(1->4)-GalNAc-alpha-(1->3)-diNAcBac-PP-undecaprenol alpha-1,4-N-acetyl-D-galactosaminyltransferase